MRARPKYSLCWLTLIVVLAGTPARQVEAASDLARTLAGLGVDSPDLTKPDGGVGDDALEAVASGGDEFSVDPDLAPDRSGLAEPSAGWPLAFWSLAFPDSRFGTHPVSRPPDRSSRRQAWLQRWLI